MGRPLRVGVLSSDAPALACPQIRLIGPLRALGSRVELLWATDTSRPTWSVDPSVLTRADVIVIQRFFPQPNTAGFLDEVFASDRPVVYELDDWVLDAPECAVPGAKLAEWRPFIEYTLRRASAVSTTTERLAGHLRRYNERVHVLANGVDGELWHHRRAGRERRRLRIGFAGTPSHTSELEALLPALREVARRYPGWVAWRFAGCVPADTGELDSRSIAFEPDYARYAGMLRALELDLALLPTARREFELCKSPIRFLELSAAGVPVVVGPAGPYDLVRHCVNGIRVSSDDPGLWADAISGLVEDALGRRAIAEAAQAEVLEKHEYRMVASAWSELYEGLSPRAPARGRRERVYEASVVIPSWNGLHWLQPCLKALARHTDLSRCEVIVVDNGSDDGTAAWVESLGAPFSLVRNAVNLGFACASNQGARAARGRHLIFLNNDTEVCADWLDPLLAELEADPYVDVVGARLLYPGGRIQHAGVAFAREPLIPYHVYAGAEAEAPFVRRRRVLRAVTAACMAVRRETFEGVGGFDEGYRNGFEDIDLCLKVGARGGRIVYRPDCTVVHHEERTPGRKDRDAENYARFIERWGSELFPDEDWVLGEDAKCLRVDPSRTPPRRYVVAMPSAERSRYDHVIRLQQALARRGLAACTELLGDLEDWPDDEALRAWARSLCERLGDPELCKRWSGALPEASPYMERALRALSESPG